MPRPFNVWTRPPSNYHLGQPVDDPTGQAFQSNYRVGGDNIYSNQDGSQPMEAEITGSPITDPNIANAVSRVTYNPQKAFVTETPQSRVAQPFTYEEAARQVSPDSYSEGTDPTIFTAFQTPPTQQINTIPQEGQSNIITSPGRIAEDGGLLLPPPSESFVDPNMGREALEFAHAQELMRLHADQARHNGGIINASGPGQTITTPTTTGVTIPLQTGPPPAPTPPYTESLATIIRKPFQKLQGALATPDQIAPAQLRPGMVPSHTIPVGKQGILGLPWWAWLVVAGGAYMVFRKK